MDAGRSASSAVRSLVAAVTLLTIVPVPARWQRHLVAADVSASAAWFPLVGGLLGFVIGLIGWAVAAVSGPLVAGAFVAMLMAGLTGAIHLDGIADFADALGARGRSRERRLEIMRDPATGAYGTVAIVGWFAIVAAGAASVPPSRLPVLLGVAMLMSRLCGTNHARRVSSARSDGLGASFEPSLAAVGWGRALGALFLAFLVFGAGRLGVGLTPPDDLAPMIVLVAAPQLAVWPVDLLAGRLLGGRTGDTIGTAIALAEAVGVALLPWVAMT